MGNWEVIDNTGLIKQILQREMAEAVRDLSKNVVETAKDNSPVKTGQLRDSINASAPENWGRGIFFGIVWIGADYGLLIHNGFYHIGSGRRVAARPFLRDAVVTEWPRFKFRCQEIFNQALKY